MLDPAILLSLQVPFPPEQPVLVQERMLTSSAGTQADRIGRRLADGFDVAADEWIAGMKRARVAVEHSRVESTAVDEDIRTLTAVIEDFEAVAGIRAKRSGSLQRKIAREVKEAFKVDPSVAAARRAFGGRIIATEKRVVDALLDYALFLRAVRADINPASRGGRTFDNTNDLERQLASIGAA